MKRSIRWTLAVWLGSNLVGVTGMFAARAEVPTCSVTITSPESGEMVGRQRLVSGKAAVPSYGHLWTFVHIRGLAGWWPQGGGEAELIDGRWDVMTFFGQSHDVGVQFEITALVVTDSVHNDLVRYVERSAKANDWAAIPLPNVMQGCAVARTSVVKASH